MWYTTKSNTSRCNGGSMYQFIVNPSAGAGRGYRIWKKIERQLENDSQEYRVFFTERQGDAAEIAKTLTADKDEAKILVVVGGEGTYNEVLNGVSFKGMVTLGYVPAGFRNALSKGFQSYRKVNGQIKKVLHPKYYKLMNYGVLTSGGDEIFNRRFGGRCGIGLDAAICHNLLCCSTRHRMSRMNLNRLLNFTIGMKQWFLAKPVKGYIVFDGVKRVEFNHIYFITFHVCEENQKKKGTLEHENEGGKMKVYVANSSRKSKMVPILMDVVMGVRKKERGIRIFECSEASVHLSRPLAVHVDGESCLCQQDMEIRCIPKRIRVIGS